MQALDNKNEIASRLARYEAPVLANTSLKFSSEQSLSSRIPTASAAKGNDCAATTSARLST